MTAIARTPLSATRVRLALSALVVLGLTSGCRSVSDPSDWRWELSPTVTSVDWDSKKDPGLTVLTTDCSALSGNDHSLVAGLTGFKEPGANLDRFIASLDLECSPYVEFGGRYIQSVTSTRPTITDTVTTNLTFRTTAGERPIRLNADSVPIGVVIYHNNKNYVQNLQLIFGKEENGVVTDYVNWYDEANFTEATISDYPSIPDVGLLGTPDKTRSLRCPSQSVITGVRIRQSSNGKIRFFGIDCQQLSNN